MDKSRRFGLPNIEDLTKNQEKIMALPNEGRYLIAGGPGTGKSVMALFRIKRLQREQKMYHCLVYNKLLNESNQQLADAHDTVTTQIHLATYLDWFNNQIYKKIFHKTVPRINITENYNLLKT